MFDLVTEVGHNELFFAEAPHHLNCLQVCFQKHDLLSDVVVVFIISLVVMDLCKEGPVIKVIDGIFKDGIAGSVSLKAMIEPAGERLQWLFCGVDRGCIELDDAGISFPSSLSMES